MRTSILSIAIPALFALSGCQSSTCDTVDIKTSDDIAEVARCHAVTGDLRIVDTSLESLRGLERISSVRNLVVGGNPQLADMSGLRGLSSAAGVTVQYNERLQSLEGLERLERLEGLVVLGNHALRTLDGLDNLLEINELIITDNPQLESLDALASLQRADHVEIQPGFTSLQVSGLD